MCIVWFRSVIENVVHIIVTLQSGQEFSLNSFTVIPGNNMVFVDVTLGAGQTGRQRPSVLNLLIRSTFHLLRNLQT